MQKSVSRRTFLGAAAALGASGFLLPNWARAAQPQQRLVAATRTIEVNGRAATVYGLTNSAGNSGLILAPNERFDLVLENRSGAATSIHWHGQVPAPELDGVSETGYVTEIADGTDRAFDFAPRSGTHWMHSHHGLQEQRLLAAPLIVHDAEDVAADVQEVVVLLHDFTFRDPDEILAELTDGAGMDHGSMSSGQGAMASPMDHSMMSMDSMGTMDLNDVEFDAYLANDRTLDDPMVVRTERQGRVRLRIINGGASTAFWLDLGSAVATVVAVDGNPVQPITASRFPLAQAQRIDLMIDVPAGGVVPVFAQREGDRARTGVILAAPGAQIEKFASLADTAIGPVDMSLETLLRAVSGLSERATDIQHAVMLTGSMSPYAWSLDDRPWSNRRTPEVSLGQRVEIEFMNHTMMAHPMHLHGHHFQVVALNGKRFAGAMRDTILVPSMGTVTIAFDADNPGRWLYHCHNLYHMATGMMSELIYTT
ncbi:copper oxidase [Devosia limi DSM 17137]|uniref:Copper oxidase n=1 Tax=Devosia limi DSM 17137 TaxID=1121477 RepID=A0A0F5LST0_9HYPH|nr:multicopper oxidase family protein [Devosia limi]KKB84707.1 copper oxidase [Devosia limi DSM 17137]SHF57884.1 Tat (twin-arginine translocation) pathway signal sequence [Devosia limi DSM 17137]